MTTLRERVEALRPDTSKCDMRELNNDSAYLCGYVNAMDEASDIAADGDARIAALTGDVLYWGRQLSAAMERAERAEAEVTRLSAPVAKWGDPAVQAVYEILCADAEPPAGEHWEGFAARRIVDALGLSAPVPSLHALSFPILSRLQSGTEEVVRLDDAESAVRTLQARLDATAGALDEADRVMGHDDAETEWRGKWAYLWDAPSTKDQS